MIDTFINAIYLYDDKVVICFNLKGGKQVSGIEVLEHSEELDECSSSLLNGSPCWTRTNDPAVNSGCDANIKQCHSIPCSVEP